MSQRVGKLDFLTTDTSLSSILSPILQKGCSRLATASDKVYQLLAHGRRFSPGTPASFTTNTGRHDLAEKLLKVALNTKHHSIIIYYRIIEHFS